MGSVFTCKLNPCCGDRHNCEPPRQYSEPAATLGETIAAARKGKGWTLRDLEKTSGVSNPLISQIETGKVRDPGFGTVVKLVDALGVSLDTAALPARALAGDGP